MKHPSHESSPTASLYLDILHDGARQRAARHRFHRRLFFVLLAILAAVATKAAFTIREFAELFGN